MTFPKLLEQGDPGRIPIETDFGLDILLEQMHEHIPSFRRGKKRKVREKLDSLVTRLETDDQVIQKHQNMFRYAMENPEFNDMIEDLWIRASPKPGCGIPSQYEGKIQRLKDFKRSLSSLENVLAQTETRPRALDAILQESRSVRADIENAEQRLHPDLEFRVEVEGAYESPLYSDELLTSRDDVELKTEGVLRNKDTGLRDEEQLEKYKKWKRSMPVKSLRGGLEKEIVNRLNEKTEFSIFGSQTVKLLGSFVYDEEDEMYEGEMIYAAHGETEEIQLTISPRDLGRVSQYSLDRARENHNEQVLKSFEAKMNDFGEAVTDLKVISTVARFYQSLTEKGYPATFPEIAEQDSNTDIHLTTMYNPVLAAQSDRKEEVIANDATTGKESNVRFITGANNNGKTCYMNSVALNQALFQAGLPTVSDEARMTVKDQILTHYVRAGDIHAGESRFAHECSRINELIGNLTSGSLVLCDELFTGTAPQDGREVSELVLDKLLQAGPTMFFTTHYHTLAERAKDSPYVKEFCCELDHSTSPPSYTYEIQPGVSDDSDGLTVAAQYGVNDGHLSSVLRKKEAQGDISLRATT